MSTGFPTKANYAAGDILTAANMNDLSGTVNYLQYMPPRNGILNSNFSVWQRGTSIAFAGSAAGAYTADRWYIGGTNANQALTISRQATGDTTNLPNIQYAIRCQKNSGQTGNGNLSIGQSFESINSIPFAGKQVTFSFYARAGANFSAASNQITYKVVTGTGTDQNVQVTGYTGSADTISGTATLTTTWQRFSATATIPATTTEIGPNFSWTTVGTAGANDYFEITGVQLELGSVANTYQPNGATYQAELAACQRYYVRIGDTNGASNQRLARGSANSTTGIQLTATLPVQLRTGASSTIDYANLQWYNGLNGVGSISAITMSATSTTNPAIAATTTGVVSGTFYELLTTSTAGYIGFSAEL